MPARKRMDNAETNISLGASIDGLIATAAKAGITTLKLVFIECATNCTFNIGLTDKVPNDPEEGEEDTET